MRVFLVGFMGSGKSTTGRLLARRLGSLFLDLDARIEAALSLAVPEIFRRHGETAFRAVETLQLQACGRFSDLVVATGGGTFIGEENHMLIRSLGVSVFLDVPWSDVVLRLPGKRGERPLFGSPEQAQELFLRRLPRYRMADFRVRPEIGEDAEVLSGRLAALLERRP